MSNKRSFMEAITVNFFLTRGIAKLMSKLTLTWRNMTEGTFCNVSADKTRTCG